MLKIADPKKKFVICIYACQEGLGRVLMQEGRVIVYESQKVKEHEQRYSSYDLVLTAVVHALKVWIHYLLGKKFVVMKNHSSLTNFFK